MIRTHALSFAYRGTPQTLRFPDVDVPQGGRLLLQGRSGAGKSTWLALVAGLRTPAQGMLEVADQDVAALPAARRDVWRAASVGFLPQRLHLSAALTVAGNLSLPFFAAGRVVDDAAIRAALQRLDLATLAGRRPHELSGGQAQRVALARAVLLQPRVLLADEPTASLDDASAATALDLLQESAAACGATLVVATHDQRAARWLQRQAGTQTLSLDAVASQNGLEPLSEKRE